jgi:hypothetical protein
MKVIINEVKKNYGFKGIYVNLRGVRNLSSLQRKGVKGAESLVKGWIAPYI